MSMLDGVSQCWWLGSRCIPDWDGWSVAVASIGVLATVALGLATYRLGVAAKNATQAALEISEKNHRLQESDRQREAAVILQFLRGEFIWTAARIERFCETLTNDEVGTDELDEAQREKLAEMVGFLEMPETQSVISRLHVLDDVNGMLLARVLGDARALYRAFAKFVDPGFEPLMHLTLRGFKKDAGRLVADLRELAEASRTLRGDEGESA
ncbi:hypothetical protein I5W42_05720 [Stenotrophomonas maltophilia]|nr:hypothetical protein [Stenotrophomonas maltophilia]